MVLNAFFGHLTSSNYTICISTSESSGVPSGDIYYFEAESVSLSDTFPQKKTIMAGASSMSSKDGKIDQKVSIKNAVIIKKTGDASKTTTINNILGFLRSLQKLGSSPAYLWVYDRIDSLHLNLGYQSETVTSYIKGYIERFDVEKVAGIYTIRSLNWIGVEN